LRLVALALAFCLGALADNANWPNWRGPERNATQPAAKGVPSTWSPTENIAWRTPLPSWSASSPVVWGDTVFVASAQAGYTNTESGGLLGHIVREFASRFSSADDILLLAVDTRDGSIRWERKIGDGNVSIRKHNQASPSPVTDGRRVWVVTGGGVVSCFDYDGLLVWQRDLQSDYGEFGSAWGYASSPLLHRDRIYIQVLHGMMTFDPSYLLSLDAADGSVVWRVERPTDAVGASRDAYTTPTLATIDGIDYMVVSGAGYVTLQNLTDGKEVGRADGLIPNSGQAHRIVGSPTVVGDVLIAPSERRPILGLRMKSGPTLEQIWKLNRGSDVPTPVSDGHSLFVVTDRGVLTVFDLSDGARIGESLRLEVGTYTSSPVIADGKLYATNDDGATSVIDLRDPSKIVAVNKLGEYTLSTPAITERRIYIRTSKALYCFERR